MIKKILVIIFVMSFSVYADKAQEILDKHYEARGGINKLNSIENLYAEGRVFYASQNEWTSMKYWAKGQKKVKLQQNIQGQTVQVAYNGKNLWQINPLMGQRKAVIPQNREVSIIKPQIEQLRAILKGLTIQNSVLEINYKGIEKTKNVSSEVLNIVTDDYLSYDLFFDTNTYQLQMFRTKSIDDRKGEEIVTEVFFNKYQTVDGITFPKEYDIVINGNVVQKSEISKIEVNGDISDSIFAKP